MLLWGGLAGVMAVWAVCFRLTFWELSWDVMEPITYFIGSGTGQSQASLIYLHPCIHAVKLHHLMVHRTAFCKCHLRNCGFADGRCWL